MAEQAPTSSGSYRNAVMQKGRRQVMEYTKPEPLIPVRVLGAICPVCGKKSYSAAGVHPQCSVQLADAPRQAALAAKKKLVQAATDAAKLEESLKQPSRFVQMDRPRRTPK